MPLLQLAIDCGCLIITSLVIDIMLAIAKYAHSITLDAQLTFCIPQRICVYTVIEPALIEVCYCV